MKLTSEELRKINFSIDDIGSIFFYKERVLRAIKKESMTYVNELINSGLIDELVKKRLFPKTTIAQCEIDGYSMVLEHERLENWNYAYEWSFDMLKSVAMTVIEINEISNKYGYELFDCHASNLIFNFNKPIYVDLGSFKKTNNLSVWSAKEIFLKSYYIPLKLHSIGYSNIASNITLSVEYFNTNEFYNIVNPCFPHQIVAFFTNLRNKIDTILTSSDEKISPFCSLSN